MISDEENKHVIKESIDGLPISNPIKNLMRMIATNFDISADDAEMLFNQILDNFGERIRFEILNCMVDVK